MPVASDVRGFRCCCNTTLDLQCACLGLEGSVFATCLRADTGSYGVYGVDEVLHSSGGKLSTFRRCAGGCCGAGRCAVSGASGQAHRPPMRGHSEPRMRDFRYFDL
eukprot:6181160-Pleurochrysis_carterae.AAC.2